MATYELNANVINKTKGVLIFGSSNLTWGKFTKEPAKSIDPGKESNFQVAGKSFVSGLEGTVRWSIDGPAYEGIIIEAYFDVPAIGVDKAMLTCQPGSKLTLTTEQTRGNHNSVKFIISD